MHLVHFLCLITREPRKLGGDMIVDFSQVTFWNRPLALHVICNDVVLSEEVFSFHTPANGSWDSRYFANYIGLIVYCLLSWVHLLSQVALESWLVDS